MKKKLTKMQRKCRRKVPLHTAQGGKKDAKVAEKVQADPDIDNDKNTKEPTSKVYDKVAQEKGEGDASKDYRKAKETSKVYKSLTKIMKAQSKKVVLKR